MNTLIQDIRIAIRLMLKNPGFSLVVVLTLGLGIGANTAIFSVVNAVLLRPLAYKDSGTLVNVWGKFDKQGIPRNWLSEPEYWDLRDRNESFSELGAYSLGDGANLTNHDSPPTQVSTPQATASLFQILGVQTALGRIFTADEDQPGRNHVALLSFALWNSQFASDPKIIGKSIELDGEPYVIVGVLRKDFFLAGKQDLWIPLGLNRAKPQDRGSHYMHVTARLKPGIPLAQASAEMDRFAGQLERENPLYYTADSGWGMYLVPLKEQIVGHVRPALLVLLGAVAFVLLIACVNVANLLLTRASAREKELSIRAAMGAGRARIVRQLLTESVVLAAAGGALGLFLAYWGVYALRVFVPDNIPRMDEVQVDPLVLGFTLVISLLTGLVFGFIPAWQAGRANLQDTLKETGQSTSAARGSRRLRGFLVISEIALAVLLLVGAGLLIRSFQHLLVVSPGFEPQHLLSMRVSLPAKVYPDGTPVQTFYQKLLNRVKTVPGVQAAGAISELPLSESYSSGSTFVEQSSATDIPRATQFANLPYIEADDRAAAPGYFEAMQIPLLRGRFLTDADTATAPFVAVVDRDFANRFWPNEDPIGKRISIDAVAKSNPPIPIWRTVVGMVGHVKHYGLDVEGREQAYFPHAQYPYFERSMYLAVRTSLEPASVTSAIRQEVFAIDKGLPLYDVRTMDQLLANSVVQPRLNLTLLVAFASIALVLAAVGIYGVMAYTVTQRTHEIGIRMALGAQREDVLKQVLREGAQLAAVGLALGLVGSLAASRLIATLLFGVRPTDPLTFAAVAVILASVALAACYIPAQRATRVDPLTALRYQ
ncbi:MAG TPA: ABC transporter permease [Candidatus Acidoferrum sp.]|nr:ABC transporter permease [Candidatus Acidoferrum sp.]